MLDFFNKIIYNIDKEKGKKKTSKIKNLKKLKKCLTNFSQNAIIRYKLNQIN